MPRKKKETGRPARPLPPRIDATPEQVAGAFFSMPADHDWKYVKEPGVAYGEDYNCVDCSRSVKYPDTLHDDGRCDTCHKKAGAT